MTWNVRYFSHAVKGITSLDKTIGRIACVIAGLQPQADIIALQEIDTMSLRGSVGRYHRRMRRNEPHNNFRRFMNRLNEASRALGGHAYEAQFYPAQGHGPGLPLYSTGLAILHRSEFLCIDHNAGAPHEITHRRLKAFAAMKQKRICAYMRLQAPTGEPVDVYNTHLSLPAFFKPGRGRHGRGFGEAKNQLAEANSLLDYITQTGDPNRTVLLGDFNAEPESQVYDTLTSRLYDAHARHLRSAPSTLRAFPTGGFWRLSYRLDHIFCGDNIRVLDFEGTKPKDSNHPLIRLSDHTPLIARLSLPGAQ